MIANQRVKNEQIKRKQTCSVIFVKVFKFQENILKIAQKNFYEIIKKISWKTHRYGNHYMINMGGQKLKIGSNLPLSGPYLQRCTS